MLSVRWAFAPLLAAAFAAGCGSGGNSNVALPPAGPAGPTPLGPATPVPLPSQNAFVSQPLLAPLPTPNGGQYIYPLPAGGNYTGQVGFPTAGTIVPSGITLTLTSEDTLPAGLPVLQGRARAVQGARRIPQASAPITPFYYLTLVWSGSIQVGSGMTFTVVPPAGMAVAGASYYEAFYDPTNPQEGWQLDFAGPATSTDGKSLLFVTPASFTYSALQTYAAALYAIGYQAAAPTPAPTSTSVSSPPTAPPSSGPTTLPTSNPTTAPSSNPTTTPTSGPTARPSSSPTATPSSSPTATPTSGPTATPTSGPTARPSSSPTATPTSGPTARPTSSPTASPTPSPTPTVAAWSVIPAPAAPITPAGYNSPFAVAVDGSNNVYVADGMNNRIVKITSSGTLSVLPAPASPYNFPKGIAVDSASNVYVADWGNNRILKIAGGGTGTQTVLPAPGAPISPAGWFQPFGVAVDTAGNLYVADTYNNRVVKVANGGTGTMTVLPAPATPINPAGYGFPTGVAVDNGGNVYVTDDANSRVIKITSAGTVSVLGAPVSPISPAGYSHPFGVAVDGAGNVYVTDNGTTTKRVTKFTVATGLASLLPAPAAPVNPTGYQDPRGIAVNSAGAVYVTDGILQRITKYTP